MIQEIWPKCVPTPDHRTKLSAQVTPGILSNHSLCPKCIPYACDLFYAGILFKYNTVIKSVRNVEQGKECERCCFIDACGSSQIQKGGSRPKIFDQTHLFINFKKIGPERNIWRHPFHFDSNSVQNHTAHNLRCQHCCEKLTKHEMYLLKHKNQNGFQFWFL